MIRVYHYNMLTCGVDGWCAIWPQDFHLVAEVDTNDMEEAFDLTNSHDTGWWNTPRVKCVERDRSTSAGDMLETHRGLFQVTGHSFEQYNAKMRAR